MAEKQLQFETLVSLCKRRGFVFPSSEIYGGIGGPSTSSGRFWDDHGPLGVLGGAAGWRGVPSLLSQPG